MPISPTTARKRGRRVFRRRSPVWLYPRHVERDYEAWLVEHVAHTLRDSARRHLLPALPQLVSQAGAVRPDSGGRLDAWPDDVTRLVALVRGDLEVAAAQKRTKALSISLRLSEQNRGQWAKILHAIGGANPFTAEPWLRPHLEAFAAQNSALITSLQGEAIGKIEGMTLRGLTTGLRVEEITEQIEGQFDVTESRARLIARDQTAKLNGDMTELRQKDAGVTRYVWRTARDERVRGNPSGKYPGASPSHWVMEGLECPWDDDTVYITAEGKRASRASIGGPDGHPGQTGYSCRCGAEPILSPLMDEWNGPN